MVQNTEKYKTTSGRFNLTIEQKSADSGYSLFVYSREDSVLVHEHSMDDLAGCMAYAQDTYNVPSIKWKKEQ